MQTVEEKQKWHQEYGEEKTIHIYKVQKQYGEEGYEQYNSEINTTYAELAKKMKEKYSNFEFGAERTIQIHEYTEGGRVKTIQI